jgi:hypothetical protein
MSEELSNKDAREYLKEKYGIEVTSVTIYNWIKRGRRGIKLASNSKVDIAQFVQKVGKDELVGVDRGRPSAKKD